jgi:hypothetical protein
MSYRVDTANRANTFKVYGHNDGSNYSMSKSVGIQGPVMTSGSGYYVVPNYSMPGYDSLSHGSQPTGNAGYFQIGRAYSNGNGYTSTDAGGKFNCRTTYSMHSC